MLKNILTAGLALCCALAGFELFLTHTPYANGVSPMVYDAELGMWHKRNFRGRSSGSCFDTVYAFDDAGRPVMTRTYDRGKPDVVILGDSYIEAVMVPSADILHNALADELEGRYNVLNYGLAGSSPVQQFVILHDRVNLQNTRLVIQFVDLESDLQEVLPATATPLSRPRVYVDFVSDHEYRIRYPAPGSWRDSLMDVLGNFQIYYFVKKVAYGVLQLLEKRRAQDATAAAGPEAIDPVSPSAARSQAWHQLGQALVHSHRLIARRNPQTDYRLVVQSKEPNNRARLGDFLDRHAIAYSYLDELTRRHAVELPTLACDFHWSAEAHRRLAWVLVRERWLE